MKQDKVQIATASAERSILRIMKDNPVYTDASRVITEKLIQELSLVYKDAERKVVLKALISFTDALIVGLKDGQMGRSAELSYVKNQIDVARTGLEAELQTTKDERLIEEVIADMLK